MNKVNMDVVKPWITKRVTEILGFEDDVVIEFIFNLFEGNQVSFSHDFCPPLHNCLSQCSFLIRRSCR